MKYCNESIVCRGHKARYVKTSLTLTGSIQDAMSIWPLFLIVIHGNCYLVLTEMHKLASQEIEGN